VRKFTPDDMARHFMRLAAKEITAQEMRDFGNIVVLERKAHFQRHEGPDGETWAALAPSTIKSKGRAGHTTKYKQNREGNRFVAGGSFQKVKIAASGNPSWPLVRTGEMMNAYIGSATKKRVRVQLAKSRIQDVSGGKSIAQIHNEGLGNNPKRVHIGIPKEARERINAAFKAMWEKRVRDFAK